MRFDTLIRNATVVTASDTYSADIGLADEKISAIAAQLPADRVVRIPIDA